MLAPGVRDYVARLTPAQKVELDRMLAPEIEAASYGDSEWRIDNLYWVQDEHGREVPFRRNEVQRQWWDDRWLLEVILKARQLGFSTVIALEILDACLFEPNTAAGIIDYSLDDAKKKLAKIKFAYDRTPTRVRDKVSLVTANTETIQFSNGSRIEVGTSHRGGTLQFLHVSEFGKISAMRPDKAREIKTGGFGTVHPGGRIRVESTADGVGGDFHDMVQQADAQQKEGRPLSVMDFKLQFFPWYRHAGYRIAAAHVLVTPEVEEYFETLLAEHGVALDAEQRAWYAAKRGQIGPDEMFREYPSFPDEAFKASVEGAYFKRQMTKVRLDGRICALPYDESRLVNTFWDIGNDTTAIWFHQTDGVRHRLIDYYENQDEPITHYVREVHARRDRFGWSFGKHYGPHDLEVADWGGSGATRWKQAKDMGLKFTVVPRVGDKDDAIDAARQFLGMCWFDEKHTAQGIRCLDNYRKKWNEQRAMWSGEPLHNFASHGADSFMQGAMSYRPEKQKLPGAPRLPVITPGSQGRGTSWMGR